MSRSGRVTDGATLRHSRVMDMLQWINLAGGVTITQIQAYMLTAHGLKFSTSADYVRECVMAGVLKEDHGVFIVIQKRVQFEGSHKPKPVGKSSKAH